MFFWRQKSADDCSGDLKNIHSSDSGYTNSRDINLSNGSDHTIDRTSKKFNATESPEIYGGTISDTLDTSNKMNKATDVNSSVTSENSSETVTNLNHVTDLRLSDRDNLSDSVTINSVSSNGVSLNGIPPSVSNRNTSALLANLEPALADMIISASNPDDVDDYMDEEAILNKLRIDNQKVLNNSSSDVKTKGISPDSSVMSSVNTGESLSGNDLVCSSMTCFLPRKTDNEIIQNEGQEIQADEDSSKTSSDPSNKSVSDPSSKSVSSARVKWHNPPKDLMTPMIEALEQFSMIKAGDRVLLCLSGGKDSLSLLHLLKQYQHRCRSQGLLFELGAVTVDPQSEAYDPRPLIPYLRSLGVPYLYESQAILPLALSLPSLSSICAFCSRMKRGRIYAAARREGYDVLAFGQHLDDLAESFVMSALHNGRLRCMKAHYTVQ